MSTKWMTGTIEKSSTDPRRISFIASHEKVDRDSEVIVIAGIDLTGFLGNPRMLLHHDRTQSIANVENLRRTKIDGAPALLGEATFPDRPQSNEALADVRAGLLGAVSIGFKSLELGAPILDGQRGPTYLKTSLIEISLVSLPACATCLVISKGAPCRCHEDINLDAIEVWPKFLVGCPLKSKCPTPADGHPDQCKKGNDCPLRRTNQSGGKSELAIEDEQVLEIEDEHLWVTQSASTVGRLVHEMMLGELRTLIPAAIQKEIDYRRGRVS